ncbi:MAG: hypothetical protein RLZZ516_1036 [Cyanobacteriota bacterium]|jgi:hypothetical protein
MVAARRRPVRTAWPRLALVLALPPLLSLPLALRPVLAQSATDGAAGSEAGNPFRRPQDQRPAGLVLLREWQTMNGLHAIGVYDPKPDPRDPSARTIVVWLEEPTGVKLAVETLRCSPAAPMRLMRRGSDLVIRELNPGGPVGPANKLDHQIWWAACFPEQGGRDPATLGALARQLGYSGQLREQQQVVPGSPR